MVNSRESSRRRGPGRKKYRVRRSRYILRDNGEQFGLETSHPSQGISMISEEVIQNLKQIHEREVKTLKDRCLRSQADLENLRKRTAREREQITKFANESLMFNFLPVLDNFSHAMKAKDATGDFDSFKEGMNLIHNQLQKILNDNGLEKIEAENQKFDPHLHEAMSVDYRNDLPEDQVVEVLRDGYILKDRVLRPAMVRVSKKPEKGKPQPGDIKPSPKIKPEPLDSSEKTSGESSNFNSS